MAQPVAIQFTIPPDESLRGKVLTHTGKEAAWLDAENTAGTVTEVSLDVPHPFEATNSHVKSKGVLGFVSKAISPNQFFASPADADGIMRPRPIQSADLPIIDPIHGGTGSTAELVGNRVMISKDGKIVQGPDGIGIVMQEPTGLVVGRIEFDKHISGMVPRYRIDASVAVPPCEDKMDMLLSNDGVNPKWVPRERLPMRKLSVYQEPSTDEKHLISYRLPVEDFNHNDCLEVTLYTILRQNDSNYQPLSVSVGVTGAAKPSQIILAPYAFREAPYLIPIKLTCYRAADKFLVWAGKADEFALIAADYSKPFTLTIQISTAPATEISLTPLLATAFHF